LPIRQLTVNGVVDVLPLYDEGPPVGVVLTDKGLRMATDAKRTIGGR
jgi:hypothetical protein